MASGDAAERSAMYQLILGQLRDDGMHDLADTLASRTHTEVNSALPSNALKTVLQKAATVASSADAEMTSTSASSMQQKGSVAAADLAADPEDLEARSILRIRGRMELTEAAAIEGVDGGAMTDGAAADQRAKLQQLPDNPFPRYNVMFRTVHKGVSVCASVAADGSVMASGSADCSIKLIDMQRVKTVKNVRRGGAIPQAERPTLRTYYDHTGVVTAVDFHPVESFLASCSADCTIKFFDYQRNHKHAKRHICDSHGIKTIKFHPSGDFLLAGTDHPIIRVYDVSTFIPYTSRKGHHHASINKVAYSLTGGMYASASCDGMVKLWDTVTNNCVNTVRNAHTGAEVTSVCFSPSGKYLLSSGMDGMARMWDVGSGKQVLEFSGSSGGEPRQCQQRVDAVFSQTTDWVFVTDESEPTINAFRTRTGELVGSIAPQGTHKPSIVHSLAVSPVEDLFIACYHDFRCRIYAPGTGDVVSATPASQEQTRKVNRDESSGRGSRDRRGRSSNGTSAGSSNSAGLLRLAPRGL